MSPQPFKIPSFEDLLIGLHISFFISRIIQFNSELAEFNDLITMKNLHINRFSVKFKINLNNWSILVVFIKLHAQSILTIVLRKLTRSNYFEI